MVNLRCPCGLEVRQRKYMGLVLYKHLDDDKYCELLTETITGDTLFEGMKINFPDFYNHALIKKELEGMEIEKSMTSNEVKSLAITKELLKRKGDKESIKEFLSSIEGIIKEGDNAYKLIYRFGRDMEILLSEVGIIELGAKVYRKSLNYIDLGVIVNRNQYIQTIMSKDQLENVRRELLDSSRKVKNG